MFKALTLLFLAALASGCGTTTTIRALEPAEVNRSAALKQVGILEFDESKRFSFSRYGINFAEKLEARLASYQLDGQNYFIVVSRSDLNEVLDEQKLQHSGLMDDRKIAEIGKLTGAQALISGTVSSASSSDSHYREQRTRQKCDSSGRDCTESEYSVSCTVRVIGFGVQIRMVDVERGDLVTAQSFNETREWSACKDKKQALPSLEQGVEALSNLVAKKFVDKITPKYVSFEVALLDDLDVSLPSEQEKRFDAAIDFVDAGRLDRAGELFGQLHRAVQQQSYAIAYNLGVIKESEGHYQQAKQLYHVADQLTLQPIDEINAAVQRIDRLQANNERALSQLNRD